MSESSTPGASDTAEPREAPASQTTKRSEHSTSGSGQDNTKSKAASGPAPFGVGLDGGGDPGADRPARPPRRKKASSAGRSKDAEQQSDAPAKADAAGDEARPSRRRGGRKRGKRSGTSESAEGEQPSSESNGEAQAAAADDGEKPKRKRRSRGGRRRKSAGAGEAGDETETVSDEAPAASAGEAESAEGGASEADGEECGKRRRRGTRGGRRRRKSGESTEAESSEEDQGEVAETPAEPRAKRVKKAKKKARRSRRDGGRKSTTHAAPATFEAIPGEEDDLPELLELPPEAELVEEDGGRGRRTKQAKKKGEKEARVVTEDEPREELILVNAKDKLESRVAVVANNRIRELSLEVARVQSFVHNIYRGKVVNIEPAIGAAFVDFGQGKNGFLHVSDVLPEYGEKGWDLSKLLEAREGSNDDVDLSGVESDLDAEDAPRSGGKQSKGRGRGRKESSRKRPAIGDLLKNGDKVVVQITKDAIGDKGPTLTTYISIPGRYNVLMPSLEMIGVSRKIEDEKERKRLRKVLQSFDVPGGMGLIVRTAGIGKAKADLKRDLDYLLALWKTFSKRLTHGKTPTPLYQENDLAVRIMRDMFSRRTDKVIVDDPEVCEAMREFAEKLMPEHVERIVPHDGNRPLFHTYGVEQDYEKIFVRRVELPSGGSIVIDQTEALVAIDVNSGRTREDGAVFEDIALKTNLEALTEIALQVKLRDLGGILVLDFIDMMRKSSRLAVERGLREAMSTDRARHKVGRISQFGLLELTRQRLGPGLSKLIYTTCQHCRGTGRLRTPEARAQGILRRLASALTQKGFSLVEVRTQPEVVDFLERTCRRDLDALSKEHGRELTLIGAPDQLEESVLRYLRADGREVRPGGRRKKR